MQIIVEYLDGSIGTISQVEVSKVQPIRMFKLSLSSKQEYFSSLTRRKNGLGILKRFKHRELIRRLERVLILSNPQMSIIADL
jgi:hypothetical protein